MQFLSDIFYCWEGTGSDRYRNTTDSILELILLLLSTTKCGLYEGHTIHYVDGLVVTIDRADTTDNH